MDTQGDIAAKFAACKALADRSEPLTAAEISEYNAQRAREYEKAEAARAGQTPQAALPLDQAA